MARRLTRRWRYIRRTFTENTLLEEEAADNSRIITPPTVQTGENCFQHHLGKTSNHCYRFKCTRTGVPIRYTIVEPPNEGDFAGAPYIDEEGNEKFNPGLIFNACRSVGLPTLPVGNPNHRLTGQVQYQARDVNRMKSRLFHNRNGGPIMVIFLPRSGFPVKLQDRDVYSGQGSTLDSEGKPFEGHTNTVIGYGHENLIYQRTGEDGRTQTKIEKGREFWICENSWEVNESYNRIEFNQIKGGFAVNV